MDDKSIPGKLQVVIGDLCYSIHLWWEVPPLVVLVMPQNGFQGVERKKLWVSHVDNRVGNKGQS